VASAPTPPAAPWIRIVWPARGAISRTVWSAVWPGVGRVVDGDRLVRDPVGLDDRVLGVRALREAEDLLVGLDTDDVGAHGDHLTGEVLSEREGEVARDEASESLADLPVDRIDARGVDAHEDVGRRLRRNRDVLDLDPVGVTVVVNACGFHAPRAVQWRDRQRLSLSGLTPVSTMSPVGPIRTSATGVASMSASE
jgi:hypothetical protein